MSQEHAADDELRGLGTAALHEHEVSVSDAEIESALVAVRGRIAAGDDGAVSPLLVAESDRRERPAWALLAGAAAVVAMIAGGLVVAFGGSDDDTIVPATDAPQPEITSAPTTPNTTVEPEDSIVTETTPASTEVAASTPTIAPRTIPVDAADPPLLVEPVVYASVPLEPDPSGSGVSVAIGPDNIVVKQPVSDFVSLIGPPDVTVQQIRVPVELNSIVSGPGPVIYGIGGPVFDEDNQAVPRGFRFVAVPFLGDRVGEVVAETEVGVNDYLELPDAFFGHGPVGVVDRGRQVGRTVIDYVDETGAPLEATTEFPLPAFADPDGDGIRQRADVIEVVGSSLAWRLDIRRDPTNASSFVGPTFPAPTTNERVIYFERIGSDLTPEQDFGPSALPVIAILNPDGTGSWVRLPEEWDVVASDVWGTVLMRRTENDLEFALLDDALEASGYVPPSPTDAPPTPEPAIVPSGMLAIPRNCVPDVGCTQLASTEDGRIVAYDPTDETLRIYDRTGSERQVEVPIDAGITPLDRAWLVAVGPDDVAYLAASTAASVDSQVDLLAIPLVGDSGGQVVVVWTGVDGSGDSTLVSRRTGLTVVPCCGDRVSRPAPDAPIYPWTDRNGAVTASTAPSFDLTLGDAGSSLTRIDGEATFTRFTLPTVFQDPRDFPTTVATDDGGALALDLVMPSGPSVIVDFNTDWPEFGIDNGDVHYVEDALGAFGSILLEPAGTVVVVEDDRFVRRTLDEVGTRGWPRLASTDVETGVVTAPGLNEYIDENAPSWAADPDTLAYQLVPWIGPNERVTVEFDDAESPIITITTSGFLDDSVAASQRMITTELGDDGLLRFVTGTYGQQCQPGRGHQDFSTEPCI